MPPELSGNDQMRDVGSMIGLLRRRARLHGGRRAFVFLQDGKDLETHLTYEKLDERARSIAAHLQSQGMAGERVLLLLPSGRDFVTSFFGCLYAGAVAVPVNPPRSNLHLSRLRDLVDDAKPKVALTSASILARVEPALEESGLAAIPWRTPQQMNAPADAWRDPGADRSTLALLQYTSGSISEPKGVMISHGNLLSNHAMIREAFGQTEQSTIASWLPLFHDMGLIGNVLQAIYLGTECLVMPPEMFLMRPARWLQAISRHGSRQSGGPNFAYELCARKITPEQRAELDLSGWELAYVGAEPVNARTLDRFAETFAPCGFRREAFYPCYGLAEATLFVSGGSKSAGFFSKEFSAQRLEQDLPAASASVKERTLVGCGHSWQELQIAIVNPANAMPCPSGQVGEVWLSGPSVAQGYWHRSAGTTHTFRAGLADGDGAAYLRTGDLGFVHEDRLFIVGRLKDLIIIAGRNHHPEDIERTAETSHPAIRPGCCAAFGIDDADGELLVIATELERTHDPAMTRAIVSAIRQAVAEQHDLGARVVFLKPAGIPRTSSGKIRRQACRVAFLAGALNVWKEPK